MIAVMVKFEVKDEVKKQLADIEIAKSHINDVVERCRKVPGLLEKYFIMDPKTYAQGAFLLWDKEESFRAYEKSAIFKETVYDICTEPPRIEVFMHTANLTDGLLI